MLNKRVASVALLAFAVSVAVQGYAETANQAEGKPIDATSTLPDAKPGECYAKVIVPAEFELRPDEVEISPESETIEIVPTAFDVEEIELQVKPEYTQFKAVPTVYRNEVMEVEVEPGRNEWYTSLRRNGIPASPALIVAAKTSGVDIDTAEANACYREYFEPAKFEFEDKQILVKEETEEFKVTEAVFEETEEELVIRQSHVIKNIIPAAYEESEIKVEIEPAKAVWKKGAGLVERIDNTTGEIMCLVQVPAKFETIKKQILKAAAKIEDTELPAERKPFKVQKLVSDSSHEKFKIEPEYTTVSVRKKVADPKFSWVPVSARGDGTYTGQQICLKEVPAKVQKVTKRVVEKQAVLEEEKMAPETQIVQVQKVATAAEVKRSVIPAKTRRVEKRVRVSKERLEWRSVLCRTNMTTDVNKRIQIALKEAGFYNSTIDGNIGRGTLGAVERYQRANDLPRGGLTMDMLEHLGVNLK